MAVEGFVPDFLEVKVEDEGEQWKIFVIAKVAEEGLVQEFWGKSGGNEGFLV